jgi:hypothetical protein
MREDDPTQPIEPVADPAPAPEAAPTTTPAGEEPPAAEPPPADVAAAEATPAAEPVAIAAETPAAPTRRNRWLGRAGQVVGIVGIAVCIGLAVGVLLGRGWAVDTVDDLAMTVDAQIARADPLLADATTKISEVSGRVSTVSDIAQRIADTPNPAPGAGDGLRSGLATLSDRYLALRTTYADAKETATSMIDRLETLDRLVPAIEIPQGPIDALAALDQRVTEIDETVMGIISVDLEGQPVRTAAAAVVEKAAEVDAKLARVTAGIEQVEQRLDTLQAEVAAMADTASTAITVGTLGAILLLAWIAVLHWILFRHSSEIRARG